MRHRIIKVDEFYCTQKMDQAAHMNSISKTCNEFKKQYDSCFHVWFSEKFLEGDKNDSTCDQLLEIYQQCLKEAMKEQNIELKEIEENHLGTEKEKKQPS
ncbi:TP53-regulated inhibitor of apoptosis 1-like isoform X1 [Vespa crabro]|uniref:TP53-regulated inhibitor of apoptosis 1-like isoform X1 n=2 Tax=Vespa crabro TaxID=7445 RepID=UPI001F014927|nr:TP53-regulated inhibitor of apoptosis 1-like isoform X1 [Vespa crabro]